MTGRGLSLVAAARRALVPLAGVGGVYVVRERGREEVPLGRHVAHVLEPRSSETLHWPESADWQYELHVMTVATVGRARAGTEGHERLAAMHEAALSAISNAADITAVVADGPPLRSGGMAGLIGGARRAETVTEKGRAGEPMSLATEVGLGVWVGEPSTSVTLDGASLFAGGPHELRVGSPVRATGERVFNSLRGVLLVDLGERPRTIVQAGRLSAASAQALGQLETAIEARIDGQVHELVDRDGTHYANVRMERFVRRGPVEVGSRYHRAYEIEYTQVLRESE